MIDPVHPQWFRHRPDKALADPTYQSPRLTLKSNALKEIENKQRQIAGERLPNTVTKLGQSNR